MGLFVAFTLLVAVGSGLALWALRRQRRPAFDGDSRITGWGIAHGAAWAACATSVVLLALTTLALAVFEPS